MKCHTAAALALLVAGASVALAQAPAPAPAPNDSGTVRPGARNRAGRMGGNFMAMRGAPRVSGEITKVEGNVYSVRTMRGETVKVTVPTGTQIMKQNRVAGTTADLKVGVFITAMGDNPAGTQPGARTAPAPGARVETRTAPGTAPEARTAPGTGAMVRPATPANLTARRVTVLNPMAQGTIESISARAITLRTPDGKSATYTIDTTTRFMQNRQQGTWSTFKGGDRVIVEYTGKNATTIRTAPVAGQGRGAGARMRQNGQGAGARMRRNAPGTAPGAAPAPGANRPSTGPRPADDMDGDE